MAEVDQAVVGQELEVAPQPEVQQEPGAPAPEQPAGQQQEQKALMQLASEQSIQFIKDLKDFLLEDDPTGEIPEWKRRVDKLARAVCLNRKSLVGGTGVLVLFLILTGWGDPVVYLTALPYPIIASLILLESPTMEKKDVVQWVGFWIIFGLSVPLNGLLVPNGTEREIDQRHGRERVRESGPGLLSAIYWTQYLLFLLWLSLPWSRGAELLTNLFILPRWRQYSQ